MRRILERVIVPRRICPFSMARTSPRIAIMASQKRSSSASNSDSVGSIIKVPANRKAHGRRMKAVVDEPLGNVLDRDAGRLLQRTRVDDALVRDASGLRL